MPPSKSSRRSAAARQKRAKQLEKKAAKQVVLSHQLPSRSPIVQRKGTGSRAAPGVWDNNEELKNPKKLVKAHKLLIPSDVEGKKFVLFAGDSHLRSLVFQKQRFPEGIFSFGISCMPGATATHLLRQLDVHRATLAKAGIAPSLLCLLAPSNTTSGSPIATSAEMFATLLDYARETWGKVCVVDFPPRLSFDDDYQTALSEEYHRTAAACGVPYHVIGQHFPMSDRSLWVEDGTHLSDDRGLPILMDQVWRACYTSWELPPPSPPKLPFPTYATPRCRPSPPEPVSPPLTPARRRVQTRSRAQRVRPSGVEQYQALDPVFPRPELCQNINTYSRLVLTLTRQLKAAQGQVKFVSQQLAVKSKAVEDLTTKLRDAENRLEVYEAVWDIPGKATYTSSSTPAPESPQVHSEESVHSLTEI